MVFFRKIDDFLSLLGMVIFRGKNNPFLSGSFFYPVYHASIARLACQGLSEIACKRSKLLALRALNCSDAFPIFARLPAPAELLKILQQNS